MKCIFSLLMFIFLSSCSFNYGQKSVYLNNTVISKKPLDIEKKSITTLMKSIVILLLDIREISEKIEYKVKVKIIFSKLMNVAGTEKRKNQYKENITNAEMEIEDAKQEKESMLDAYIERMDSICLYDEDAVDQVASGVINSTMLHFIEYNIMDSHRKYYCVDSSISAIELRQKVSEDFE